MNNRILDFYEIDQEFLTFLECKNNTLYEILKKARRDKISLLSDEIIEIAQFLEIFIIKLFRIENQTNLFAKKSKDIAILYDLKRNFVHRFVARKYSKHELQKNEIEKKFLTRNNLNHNDLEAIDDFFLAKLKESLGNSGSLYEATCKLAYKSSAQILTLTQKQNEQSEESNVETIHPYSGFSEDELKYAASRIFFGPISKLFSAPEQLDFAHLVKYDTYNDIIYKHQTAQEISDSLIEANYCIKCHRHNKDSCSTGLKKNEDYHQNPIGNILKGCPLEIKISEMIELYSRGKLIAAISAALLENPLLILTGERICNDCSKACIYQKQTPVNVPAIESAIVKEVLSLDFGVEIYYLLTEWNPLSSTNFLPEREYKGNVLIVGSGPSAIALSYYLLRSGCKITMVEGLRIELLQNEDINLTIKKYSHIENLYNKIKPQGFGGVCEYGITERWNKENLIMARLMLERNKNFCLIGGTRFGSNITYDDAKKLGFDHVALALGAGAPKMPKIDGMDAGNVRYANDFLTALGSGNAETQDSKTLFMMEPPVFIVGGGLTSVDAAAEAGKYIIALAKKIALQKIDKNTLNKREKEQLSRFEIIAKLLKKEETRAAKEQRKPDFIQILDSLGGINLCYRQKIERSSAYRNNHEELDKSMNSGFRILENTKVTRIIKDEYGNIAEIEIDKGDKTERRKCRSLLIATGTIPSVLEETYKKKSDISFFGDMDPKFEGSVVKAIASAKLGYKKILDKLSLMVNRSKNSESIYLVKNLFEKFVTYKKDHTKDIFELKIIAPIEAQNYKPGQYFKLQNFHNNLTGKSFEPIALFPSNIREGEISFMINVVGNSTKTAKSLKKGDQVILMGPLGYPIEFNRSNRYLFIAEDVNVFSCIYLASMAKKVAHATKFVGIISHSSMWQSDLHCAVQDNLKKLQIDYEIKDNIPDIFFNFEQVYDKDLIIYSYGTVRFNEKILRLTGNLNRSLTQLSSSREVIGAYEAKSLSSDISAGADIKRSNIKLIGNIYGPLKCMMGGICGSCIISKHNGDMEFSCKSNLYSLSDYMLNNARVKLSQNSLLEKIMNNYSLLC
ncbi:MAG: FAD-dependent oxidoreductase [Rickettsiaceae bacterium]|nr:FAD-dependent oxidoreductase [Rickettsiaceae bacterium]